jgi:choline dehydrogenase-like flavoprotein
VKWAIESPGYEEAEQLLKKAQLESSFQDEVRTFLNTNLPQYTVLTAPMAVQHSDPQNRQVPGGVFSTADLLMESRISGGPTGNQNLTINLNHAVTRIETTGNRATGVVAYDLISNQQRTFHADTVVLAAGTVESAKIAQLSNLADPNGKIGVGITDHPIFFKHFALPPGTPLYDKSAGAKLLLRHRSAAIGQHRYNIVIELGTDFNQGRFIDPDILRQQQNIRDDVMLCEIVFLFDAPLIETNTVQQTGPSYTKPFVTMQEGEITVDEWNEIDGLTQQIISQLGGQALAGDDLTLDRAGLGGVAHEVGTLRLGPDGVVDNDLKFYAYDNLYACDLSVFPSSPAANPTLTLAALALRLATHLRDQRM